MVTKDLNASAQSQAYRRWEMDPLDKLEEKSREEESRAPENTTPDTGTEPAQQPEEPAQIVMPTEEEVAAVFQSAKDEGYAAGYLEGQATGYAEGRNTAETEVKAEVQRIQTLLSQLERDLHALDQQTSDQLLELAIALAKKMVTQALKAKPELIVPIVQEAIRNLPNALQPPRLYLHPDDAKLVAAHLSDQIAQEHWSIREDERIDRGGCRIEANGCEINGDLKVRWQRTLSAIGQQDDWLDKDN